MEQDLNTTLSPTEREREFVVQCIVDAHEALRVIAGVDENGPILVWLADQLLQTRRRSQQTP